MVMICITDHILSVGPYTPSTFMSVATFRNNDPMK
jgi:hypothetical protein